MKAGILYFDPLQLSLLAIALLLLLSSLISFQKGKHRLSIVLLTGAALATFCFAALLDPFLNQWDERFHALVAKNMTSHPFKPMLYANPIVDTDYEGWAKAHIWLHKQPLFLWTIALSFKLFGYSEFSLRLPSVLLATAMVPVLYRAGKLLLNPRSGYIAALLWMTTIFVIELVAGREGSEHNDIAFVVWIGASIWSWLEYVFSGKTKWLWLTGLFAGFAILCKWLVGLLVYAAWGLFFLAKGEFSFKAIKAPLLSFLTTLVVALPWQVYTFARFPLEAAKEFKFNTLHFNTVIEGHAGGYDYHFLKFNHLYGEWTWLLLIPGLWFFFAHSKNKKVAFALLGMLGILYLFFSLAATKMPAFTLVGAFVILLLMAASIDGIAQLVEKWIPSKLLASCVLPALLVATTVFRFDLDYLIHRHTDRDQNGYRTHQMRLKDELFQQNIPPNGVLFNVPPGFYVEAMFYSGVPAYGFSPNEEQTTDLKQKGYEVIMWKSTR